MIQLNQVHIGHFFDLIKFIEDETVDCVVTSPPYYGLRNYKTKPQIWLKDKNDCGKHKWDKNKFCLICHAWLGELGLEPSFDLYLKHLMDVFTEIKRVLKKTGSCWINLGDTYNGSGQDSGKGNKKFQQALNDRREVGVAPTTRTFDNKVKRKSLLGIPNRFSTMMIDDGWILRNEIIWWKRNCMPSSAKDRFTVDYEKVFFFTKSDKYFFEQQYEKWTDKVWNDIKRAEDKHPGYDGKYAEGYNANDRSLPNQGIKGQPVGNPFIGRNKRSVWDVLTSQFSDAHFATFPEKLIIPMIKAGCPEEICNGCKKPRKIIYEKTGNTTTTNWGNNVKYKNVEGLDDQIFMQELKVVGLTKCNCKKGFHPGIVFDPFGGSGTTGIVTRKLSRNYILFDVSELYAKMAMNRIADELGLFQ